jgi:TonB family protein
MSQILSEQAFTADLSEQVFTAAELARAAGVPLSDVEARLAAGEIRPVAGTPFITAAEAIRAGRSLRAAAASRPQRVASLFALSAETRPGQRSAGLPAFASSAFHAALVAVAVWLTTGADTAAVYDAPTEPARLVFIMSPGPGGGGGGGGLRNPLPAPRAKRRAVERARVSTPEVTPPPPPPSPKPVEPPPEPLPARAIVAPIVTAKADPVEQPGVIEKPAPTPPNHGPGTNGGAGSGQGAGNGEGFGSGIGDGAGGGIGGGPYRPGSGVTPPRLLREVKAEYTDEARRRGITGDVLLEIVVRRDGSVGDVDVRRGLGLGLDQRAVTAVRQWRFDPARLRGTPVDVIVEVAVEFTLR